MSYQILNGFPGGLDFRKIDVTSPVGTLVELNNGFINPGQEIEKRKAFVATALPANTFGLQATTNGIYTFGSIATPAEFPVDVSGFLVNYKRLQHPDGSTAMSSVVASCAFQGLDFVLAEFTDGKIFPYFNGSLVKDFTNGVVLAYLNTNILLAQALVDMINADGTYAASRVGAVVTIAGSDDKDFELSTVLTTSAGTLAINRLNTALPALTAVAAAGQFEIYAGKPGTSATVQVAVAVPAFAVIANNQTITVAGRVYTFKTALTPANNEVKIDSTGASITEKNSLTLINLAHAINRDTVGDGVDYYVTSAHATVYVPTVPTSPTVVMTLQAKVPGYAGNSLTASDGTGTFTFTNSGAFTTGGDYGIFRVLVNGEDLFGNYATNLSGYPSYALGRTDAAWKVNNQYCAALTAAAINNYSTTYRAENDGAIVRLFATTAGSSANGYKVQVYALGLVAIGKCALQFSGKKFTVNKLLINGAEVISSAKAFDATTGGVLSDFVQTLSDTINTNSDYISLNIGETLYISRFITSSDDLPIDVQVDITPVEGGAVTLISEGDTTPQFAAHIPDSITGQLIKPYQTIGNTTCLVGGGIEPYKFLWKRVSGSSKISALNAHQQSTQFGFGKRTPANTTASFQCLVTDSSGVSITSNTMIVTVVD